MKIRCGEFDVYATGSVQAFGNEPIKISLNDINKVKAIIFNFVFEDDHTEEESMRFSKIGVSEFQVSLINFSKSIGSGSMSPMKLGAIFGRELYFSYRVNTIPASDEKLFYYSWYLGETTKKSSLYFEI